MTWIVRYWTSTTAGGGPSIRITKSNLAKYNERMQVGMGCLVGWLVLLCWPYPGGALTKPGYIHRWFTFHKIRPASVRVLLRLLVRWTVLRHDGQVQLTMCFVQEKPRAWLRTPNCRQRAGGIFPLLLTWFFASVGNEGWRLGCTRYFSGCSRPGTPVIKTTISMTNRRHR